jgi:CheY-like chemotaxis protein
VTLRANTGAQALALTRTARPDLVIVDSRLPDASGVEVCRALRNGSPGAPPTPVMITTSGTADREERLAAHQAGAWELVSQPLDDEILLLKIDVIVRSKRESDRLLDASLLEGSTELYSMRGLVHRAREMSAEARRMHAPLACVAFGPELVPAAHPEHAASNDVGEVIVHLGALVHRNARASDAIGRVGETDFAIIAPFTAGAGAVRMVQRFQQLLAADPLSVAQGGAVACLRGGYCAVPDVAESAVDAAELLLRATTALRFLRSGHADATIQAFEDVPTVAAM